MSSSIKPDNIKNFTGISENKWIQGPTFKEGTVLFVKYLSGTEQQQNSVEERIDQFVAKQTFKIEVLNMQNNDTGWLEGYEELDGVFDSPNHDDNYDININNYPDGFFRIEGKILEGEYKNEIFDFIYPRDKFSITPIKLKSKTKKVSKLQDIIKNKLSTSDMSYYRELVHAGKKRKKTKNIKTKRRKTKRRKTKRRKTRKIIK